MALRGLGARNRWASQELNVKMRTGLVFSAAVPLLVAGCASKASDSGAQALVKDLPEAIPTLFLLWDYRNPHPGISFEVWSSTDLVDWRCHWVVSDPPVAVGGKRAEFFRVRAVDNATGVVSEWAHH